jgi:hypothetical protein
VIRGTDFSRFTGAPVVSANLDRNKRPVNRLVTACLPAGRLSATTLARGAMCPLEQAI